MMKKSGGIMNEKYLVYVRNERGAQALEWVALGLVVIAIMSAIAMVWKDPVSVRQSLRNWKR